MAGAHIFFHWARAVLFLGLLTIALAAACSSDGGEKQAAVPPKRRQLATPPTIPDGGNLAVAELVPETEIHDGRYAAKIASIDEDSVTIDFVGWYTGENAEDTPGGFLLLNEHPETRALPLTDDVVVTSIWADYEILSEITAVTISLSTLIEYFNDPPDEYPAMNIVSDPFWVTLENGKITRLDEQYVP